jgi:hypothetical protein
MTEEGRRCGTPGVTKDTPPGESGLAIHLFEVGKAHRYLVECQTGYAPARGRNGDLLYADAAAIDPANADPAVGAPSIVTDEKPLTGNGFDQVKILAAVHLAKNDVTYPECGRIYRLDGAELAGLYLALH